MHCALQAVQKPSDFCRPLCIVILAGRSSSKSLHSFLFFRLSAGSARGTGNRPPGLSQHGPGTATSGGSGKGGGRHGDGRLLLEDEKLPAGSFWELSKGAPASCREPPGSCREPPGSSRQLPTARGSCGELWEAAWSQREAAGTERCSNLLGHYENLSIFVGRSAL